MTAPAFSPQPPIPFDVDLDELFRIASGVIADIRKLRQISPLVSGAILVGQEELARQDHFDAPSIIVVPRQLKFAPGETRFGDFEHRFMQTQWLICEAHLWGEDDPKARSQVYSFGSCIELLRELYIGLKVGLGDQTNLRMHGARFEQKSDVNRRGRALVADIGLRYFMLSDRPILATGTSAGITVSLTEQPPTPPNSTTEVQAVITVT
jgi:hypothetical protein